MEPDIISASKTRTSPERRAPDRESLMAFVIAIPGSRMYMAPMRMYCMLLHSPRMLNIIARKAPIALAIRVLIKSFFQKKKLIHLLTLYEMMAML